MCSVCTIIIIVITNFAWLLAIQDGFQRYLKECCQCKHEADHSHPVGLSEQFSSETVSKIQYINNKADDQWWQISKLNLKCYC